MDLLLEGLTLSSIGIAVTFTALALIVLLIVVLRALFPARAADGAQARGEANPVTRAPAEAVDPKVAAAIAAALEHAKRKGSSAGNLGQALESGPGPWWRRRTDEPRARKGRRAQ